MKKNKALILLFHRVHPVRDVMWDPLHPKRFEAILNFIKKKYIVRPLLEVLDSNSRPGKKPFAAITFDDGYRDFIDYSLPVMDRLEIPSSLYVAMDCISKDKPTWTFEIDYLFYHTKKMEIKWTTDISFLPKHFQRNKFINKKDMIAYCLKFKQYIKIISQAKRQALLQDLFNSFNDVSIPKGLMMNWAEVNQVINAGVEVGSHTITHPPLATLNTSELHNELQLSRSEYFAHTGSYPKVIAYPVGSYNQQVKEASKNCGYEYGLAVNHKIYDKGVCDNFEIPRIELYNEPFWKSWLRIKEIH